jgi:NADH-quinone oxidoreductase subunit H
MMFALFFLGEYANMLLLSVIGALYFLGGWLPLVGIGSGGAVWLFVKSLFFCITFVWVRATLPRYRYDQLMSIGWKILLPLIFGLFIFYVGLVVIVLG